MVRRARGAALTRLLEAEIACKTTGWPARVLCQEALFALCAEAARLSRARR